MLTVADKVWLANTLDLALTGRYSVGLGSLGDLSKVRSLAKSPDFQDEVVRILLADEQRLRDKLLVLLGPRITDAGRFLVGLCKAHPVLDEAMRRAFSGALFRTGNPVEVPA